VGKSVVARQLVESLPVGSCGLVYDRFGAGNYRDESEPRHRAGCACIDSITPAYAETSSGSPTN
jgi:hypothetical protein